MISPIKKIGSDLFTAIVRFMFIGSVSKLFNRALLLVSCLICVAVSARAQSTCGELFNGLNGRLNRSELRLQSVESLLERIDTLKVEFRVKLAQSNTYAMYGQFTGSFNIEVFREGENVGRIHLAQVQVVKTRIPIYISHISVIPEVQGLGIGSALYAMAGRLAHLKGGLLISTSAPSSSARATWVKLEKVGLARQIPSFLWSSSKGEAPLVFLFRPALLKDRLDSYILGLQDALSAVPLFEEIASREEIFVPQFENE